MNRFVDPLFYEIAKGIGNAFGLDAGDWITIILTLVLLIVVAIILYAICVFIYVYIKDFFHNIKVNSIEKRQDYKWFEMVMGETNIDDSAKIEVNTKEGTLQFKPNEKLRYSYLTGSENMTIVIDKDVILLNPSETDESLTKHIQQFKADNEQLLNDCAVKDVITEFSHEYSIQMLLYLVLTKDSIDIHRLPLLNNTLLTFIEGLSCNLVKREVRLLPDETKEAFMEKCHNVFKEHALDVPSETCFFSPCNMFNAPYMSVRVYTNHLHPLIHKQDDIENALDELAVSQNEALNNLEKERINNMSMEDVTNMFKDVFGDPKTENENTDKSWIWWLIGAIIVFFYLMTRHT